MSLWRKISFTPTSRLLRLGLSLTTSFGVRHIDVVIENDIIIRYNTIYINRVGRTTDVAGHDDAVQSRRTLHRDRRCFINRVGHSTRPRAPEVTALSARSRQRPLNRPGRVSHGKFPVPVAGYLHLNCPFRPVRARARASSVLRPCGEPFKRDTVHLIDAFLHGGAGCCGDGFSRKRIVKTFFTGHADIVF